jgi:hypothetical protein
MFSLSTPVQSVLLTSLVAQSVQRRATVWTGFNSWQGQRPHELWAHISSGYVGLFLGSRVIRGVKLTIHIHRVPTFKNTWSCNPTPPCFFMVRCLIKHRGNLILPAVQRDNLRFERDTSRGPETSEVPKEGRIYSKPKLLS